MKRKRASILVLIIALATSWTSLSYAQKLTPAPCLWLPFNNLLADGGTTFHTISSKPDPGYTGTFSADVANATAGSASLSLPGDGSFIQADNVSDLNFNEGQAFTVSSWVKTTAGGTIWSKTLASTMDENANHSVTCFIGVDNDPANNGDGEQPGVVVVDVFYVGFVASTVTVNDGNWHHVLVTHSAAGVWGLYIDGLLNATASFPAANEGSHGEGPWSFTVGAALNSVFPVETGTGNPITGQVDEVAVWDSPLDSSQVSYIYQNGIPKATINITQQPVGKHVFGGQTATFQVAATLVGVTGTINYQWQSNNVDIVNATSATYTTPPLTASYDGTVYHCVLTSGSLQVASSDAVLSVTVDAASPLPTLWLPFNNLLADGGTTFHTISSKPDPGYTGTFSADVANATAGSASLSLPGDGSFIQADNVSDLNFDEGQAFTVSSWVKTTTGGTIWAKSLASADENGANNTVTCFIGVDNDPANNGDNEAPGHVVVDVFYVNALISTGAVNDGNWHHVLVTHSAAGVWSLYIDGHLNNTASFKAANQGANAEGPWSFTAGATLNPYFPLETGTGNPLNGKVDEVAVWTSTLSPSQVAGVYLKGVAPATPPSLHILRSGAQVTLTWTETGFKLQQNSNLSNSAGWTDVPGGNTSGVSVTIGAGADFFRLKNQ